MRGWLRSNQKTKANPRVVALPVIGRRSFTGMHELQWCSRVNFGNELQTTGESESELKM
jgi:hypothetical protein